MGIPVGLAKKWFLIPEAELKVQSESYRVPGWDKAYVLKVLGGRISYRQAEALAPEVAPLPKSIPEKGATNTEGRDDRARPTPKVKGLNRGPKPDVENPPLVAEIVARLAPNGGLRTKLDDICEAQDRKSDASRQLVRHQPLLFRSRHQRSTQQPWGAISIVFAKNAVGA